MIETSFWTPFECTEIAGHKVVTASRAELATAMSLDCLGARARSGRPRTVFDVNGHGISLRETDVNYRTAVDQADVIHADGGILVTLSRILSRTPIAERSATTDMLHDCARVAASNNLSFYLLGGEKRVNAECAQRLRDLYPSLRIVGHRDGFFSPAAEAEVIEAINNAKPDILWIGLGKPKEQIFSIKWRDHIKAGWIITCGGCFNYITGDYPRAPLWMQHKNLEWAHRMWTNPKLISRYMTTNPHAIWIIFRNYIRKTFA